MEVHILSPVRSVGGSGTEALHAVLLLRSRGVDVHVHQSVFGDLPTVNRLSAAGVTFHPWGADFNLIQNKPVVSFSHPPFLTWLTDILACKPAKLLYVSTMYDPPANELAAIARGELRQIVHVSNAQRRHHQALYATKSLRPELIAGYRPYIHLPDFPFNYRRAEHYFGLGCIQRPDPNKFSSRHWELYARTMTPKPKCVFVNGWLEDVALKTGPIPRHLLDVRTFKPYDIAVQAFLSCCHVLLQRSEQGESFGRFVIEAMAAGVPCVLEEADYNAFNEIAETGVDFLQAAGLDDQSRLASELAADEPRRMAMAYAARQTLERKYGDPGYCWPWWRRVLNN